MTIPAYRTHDRAHLAQAIQYNTSKRAADYHLLTSRDTTIGGHLAVVPRQPKVEPNLLFIAYDLLKGRPDNRDQRASQSTATIKLEYKT